MITQLPGIYFRCVLRPRLQLGPGHGRMVLKLREKGWIVILRQVIPTSPLSQLTALDMRLLGPVILVTITKMDIRHKQNT